ncbi:RNA polymerase sigma factor [Botryobacter ruber]|uniref:RNA polymerase sigma factor n=1 Tax=Botryobacter ruber TaxID=2171629 RepID=UPI000E0C2ACD|nr:sigma-70 family RNA polymerase sigma factor [Botryobacter ruber]
MNVVDQTKLNEQEMWQHFQGGDETAFSQLYQTYVHVVYNYSRKFSDDEELIEDCIHNLFLDLWKNRENLSVPTSIRFYLFASAKRRLHKEAKKKKHVCIDDYTILEAKQAERSVSIEEHLIEEQNLSQQKVLLKQGLSLLSENQQQAIYLKFYKDLSFQEISAAMNMSTDNIYKLVSRGLAVLKKNVKLAYAVAPFAILFL